MVYKGIWLRMKGQQLKKVEKAYFAVLSFWGHTDHGAGPSWQQGSKRLERTTLALQHLLYQRTPQDATKGLYHPLVENHLTTYIRKKKKRKVRFRCKVTIYIQVKMFCLTFKGNVVFTLLKY